MKSDACVRRSPPRIDGKCEYLRRVLSLLCDLIRLWRARVVLSYSCRDFFTTLRYQMTHVDRVEKNKSSETW